jgi:hypothetical protein
VRTVHLSIHRCTTVEDCVGVDEMCRCSGLGVEGFREMIRPIGEDGEDGQRRLSIDISHTQ